MRILTIVTLLILSLSRSASAEELRGLVMWHLSPLEGASPELAARVERAVRQHFEKRQRAALVDEVKMDSHLLVEGNEKFLRCGTGAECLAGLGRSIGVERVITGEVRLREDLAALRLLLVEVKTRSIVSETVVEFEGLPREDQLEELQVAMFEPERYRGSLEIHSAAQGAEVFLDGKKVGITPLVGPLADLPAGEHLLEVRKPGYAPYVGRVRVVMGESIQVTALLPPLLSSRRPFYRDWPFWTAAGVGAVAMSLAGILHRDAAVLQDNADEYRRAGLESRADRTQDQADARYLQTWLAYGVGGAGLLAAGVIAVLDLVDSPGEERHPTEAGAISLLPLPRGLGLWITGRF